MGGRRTGQEPSRKNSGCQEKSPGLGDFSATTASSMVLDKLLNPSMPRTVYKTGWGGAYTCTASAAQPDNSATSIHATERVGV